jgi:glycosyltransferase involved in cell wall biosynthesis
MVFVKSGGLRVKVALITNYPPTRGRLSEYALNLVGELEKCPSINHIDIITENTTNEIIQINEKVTLHRVWKSDNPLTLILILKKIITLKPDIVHFNIHMAVFGQSRISNFIGLSLPFLSRIIGFKTISTLHNFVEKIDIKQTGFKDTFINRFSAFLVTKLIASSSSVTLTMKSHTDFFNKRYHCKNAVTIPHGTWKNISNNQEQVCKKDSILYIGHSGPYKDINLLFDAFNILERKNRGLKLIIAGASHPNYPNYLDKYKKDTNNVSFTGYIPENQLQAIFEQTNAVILPYLTCTGTSGIAHLASSYGTPMVTTDLPEFRELAKEGCGLLISAHNPKALAEKIEEILDNPKLALELKERNIAFASSRSWKIVAEHFCSLYEKLLQS